MFENVKDNDATSAHFLHLQTRNPTWDSDRVNTGFGFRLFFRINGGKRDPSPSLSSILSKKRSHLDKHFPSARDKSNRPQPHQP